MVPPRNRVQKPEAEPTTSCSVSKIRSRTVAVSSVAPSPDRASTAATAAPTPLGATRLSTTDAVSP